MVSLGERVGSPVLFLKVTFSAGDVAAPARSPKPARRGAGRYYLLMVLPKLKMSSSSSMNRTNAANMGTPIFINGENGNVGFEVAGSGGRLSGGGVHDGVVSASEMASCRPLERRVRHRNCWCGDGCLVGCHEGLKFEKGRTDRLSAVGEAPLGAGI